MLSLFARYFQWCLYFTRDNALFPKNAEEQLQRDRTNENFYAD